MGFFEQHAPEFFGCVALLSLVGGYAGAALRDFIRRGVKVNRVRSWTRSH